MSNQPRTASVFANVTDSVHFESKCQVISKCQQSRHFHLVSRTEKQNQTLYQNPIMKLQPYLEIPILPKNSHVFNPSASEMESASDLLRSRPQDKHEIKFLKSVVNLEGLPQHSLPEVRYKPATPRYDIYLFVMF